MAVPPDVRTRLPARTAPIDPAERRSRFRAETFDISREDIGLLLCEVETHALVRRHGELTAADVMSRDIVRVDVHDSWRDSRSRP